MNAGSAHRPLVLPRRSQAWQSQNGLALVAATAVVGGVAWIVLADTRVGLILIAAGLGWFLNRVLAFRREEDAYRLVVDDEGISSTRSGDVIDTTPWARMSSVEFTSGDHSVNWGVGGLGELARVRCRAESGTGEVSLALPAFGRRALREIDETLREACAAHDVEYRSHWSW